MPLLLFLLGLLPFAVGGLMNWAMLAYPDVLPPFSLIAILFLLIWGAIAFFARPCVAGVRTLAVCLNLAAGIDRISRLLHRVSFDARRDLSRRPLAEIIVFLCTACPLSVQSKSGTA